MNATRSALTALALGLMACGEPADTPSVDTKDSGAVDSDTAPQVPDTPSTDTDTVEDSDSVGESDSVGDSDSEPVCDPAACPPAPAPTCADTKTVVTYTPACTEDGTCGFTEAQTTCAAFEHCDAGLCGPAPLCDIDFDAEGDLAAITNVTIASGTGTSTACCEDLTGDGVVDNRLGSVATTLGQLTGADLNSLLAEFMATGSLAWTLITSAADPNDPSLVTIDLLPSVQANFDPTLWLSGGAEMIAFAADAAVGDTYAPVSRLTGTVSPSGAVDANGLVVLPFPVAGLTLQLPIQQAHLRGTLARNPSLGSTVLSGANGSAGLSGSVLSTELFNAANVAFADTCGCAIISTFSGTLFDPQGQCAASVDTAACGGSGNLCSEIVAACPAVRAMTSADVDSDGDGTLDAISAGWRLEATTAAGLTIDTCIP